MAVDAMRERGADEVVLETETSNKASLKLDERLGFLRSKRLHRYYLNGNTAFRLLLYLKEGAGMRVPDGLEAQQSLLRDDEGEDPRLADSEYDDAAYG